MTHARGEAPAPRPRAPFTTITLRDPDELVAIGEGEKWTEIHLTERMVTVAGPEREGRHNVRSIPWPRIVSIDSEDVPIPPKPDEAKD